MKWPLYLVVGLAIAGACWMAVSDAAQCPESEDGCHEDVLVSEDDAQLGRRWRLRCLHCWRPTPGWRIPWLTTGGTP